MLVHGFDQRRDVFQRGELGNAVAEVENVAGMAAAVAVEHFFGFGGDRLRRGKQHRWVQIAL